MALIFFFSDRIKHALNLFIESIHHIIEQRRFPEPRSEVRTDPSPNAWFILAEPCQRLLGQPRGEAPVLPPSPVLQQREDALPLVPRPPDRICWALRKHRDHK